MVFATVSVRPTAKGLEFGLAGASSTQAAHFKTLTAEELLSLQADLTKAALDPGDYEARFDQLLEDIQGRFDELADYVASGDISPAQFRHRAERALRSGYTQAYRYGAGAQGGSPTLTDDDVAAIGEAFAEDQDYLQRFADQIADGYVPVNPEDRPNVDGTVLLSDRANMYANSVREMYYRGVVARTDDDEQIEWQLGDTDHCDPCLDAADNSPYTSDSLPGYPGEICDGGSRCGCDLVTETIAARQAEAEQETA